MDRQSQEFPRIPEIVSDYILYKRKAADENTTGLDLMNLVYLCHSWHLGIYGIPLIDEIVKAGVDGPEISSVYYRFNSFIYIPIPVPIPKHLRIDPDQSDLKSTVNLLTQRQRLLIDSVLDTYKGFDSWSLSAIAHKPRSPWDQIRIIYGVGEIIPNELIQEHYGKLYKVHNARKRKIPAQYSFSS